MSPYARTYARTARRAAARRALRHPSTLPTVIRCATVIVSTLIVSGGAVAAALLSH